MKSAILRASHISPSVSPAFSAIRPSLIPTLHFSSPPNLHKLPSFPPSRSCLSQTFKSFTIPSSSLSSKRVLSMVGSPSPKAAASFSAESNSGGGKEILVQHLLVKENDLKLLMDIQQRISGGEDLSDLAVEYSSCPSKKEGGMLGWVRKGQMVPEFEEAAFSAPLNKIIRCKTQFGWHLLQILSEREESVLQDIQPEELHVKMQDPSFLNDAQLIDVREPEEVTKASLPDFEVLPLRQFGSWAPEITTKFDPQKDTYVMGFRRIFNVAGGIHEYALKVDQSIPTY